MSIRWMLVVAATALACGCTALEISPREGDLITGSGALVPVTIQLSWPSGIGMGPVVEVDGVRLPDSALTFTSQGASAMVELAPGGHRVRVRTAQLCWICVGKVGEFDYTRRFFVASSATVSLNVAPALAAEIAVVG